MNSREFEEWMAGLTQARRKWVEGWMAAQFTGWQTIAYDTGYDQSRRMIRDRMERSWRT